MNKLDAILTVGTIESFEGAREIVDKGNVSKGLARTFIGQTVINLTSQWRHTRECLMQTSLIGGTITATVQGLVKAYKGWKTKSWRHILKGVAQASLGGVSAYYLAGLKGRTLPIINEALLFAYASGAMAQKGIKDIANGKYLWGAAQTLVGIGGVVSSGCYAYCRLIDPPSTMPPDVQRLIKNHDTSQLDPHQKQGQGEWEIDPPNKLPSDVQMFIENHDISQLNPHQEQDQGEWKYVNSGWAKTAFAHPELPSYLIKMSTGHPSLWSDQNDLWAHFKNSLDAKKFIAEKGYQHLIVPNSYWVNTPQRSILIEERLNLIQTSLIPTTRPSLAEIELANFVNTFGLCDTDRGHNADFLSSFPSWKQIGIFDFDCREKPIQD
jgi:hypothetical protein